jgi:hypothetical protein
VDRTPLQLALRDLRGQLGEPRVWGGVAVVGGVAGLVGPFGTFDLPLLSRLGYWSLVAATTFALGAATAELATAWLRDRLPRWLSLLVAGLAPGLPVTLLVLALDRMAFGPSTASAAEVLSLAITCTLISLGVVAGSALIAGRPVPIPAPSPEPAGLPRLLLRLPLQKRGRILHLRVTDHYVEVTTDRGTELLLLRLSDAIAETEGVPGLQVHRSHWVALDAVRRAVRRGGRWMLELETGGEVPVSRSSIAAAREAGLLS